jgi:hypothetical protein
MRIFEPYWNTGSPNLTSPDGKGMLTTARSASTYNVTLDWTRALGRRTGVFRPPWFAQEPLWMINGVMDTSDLRHSRKTGNWVNMEDMKYNDPSSAYYGQHLMLHDPATGKLLCNDTIRCWYEFPNYKYYLLDEGAEESQNSTNFNGATGGVNPGHGDIYLYRLAEAYLVRAEAEFYLNDIAGATNDVNTVRSRARCSQLYSTVNIGDIMNERARELHMEEWRNVELTRVSLCLALSGKPDEWGNTYDVNTWDKQNGTDPSGGSYWWQRICHYNNYYNKGPVRSNNRDQSHTLDNHNLYWPIREGVIESNREAPLAQVFGYAGYDANTPVWTTWQEAVEDEDKTE